MGAVASQITSLTNVYSTVYSGADQSTHQSPASLAFVRGIHRWPENSPHKCPVTRKRFPFDDVIMISNNSTSTCWNKHSTHWGRVTHICVGKLSIIGSDNGLSPGRRQAITRQMAAIFQTTFSNACSWIKMYWFRLRFHWSLFPWVELTIFQHWFR